MINKILPILEFRIPGLPPSVNSMYAISKKKLYKVAKTRNFQIKVVKLFKKRVQIDNNIFLWLEFHIKDKAKLKRRDLDNFLKCTIDSLQLAGQIKNDKQIVLLTASKIHDHKNFIIGKIYNMDDDSIFKHVVKTFDLYGSIGTS